MTDPTPTPSTGAPLMAAQPTSVLLRHPATKGTMWALMFAYVAALALKETGMSTTPPSGEGFTLEDGQVHLRVFPPA